MGQLKVFSAVRSPVSAGDDVVNGWAEPVG